MEPELAGAGLFSCSWSRWKSLALGHYSKIKHFYKLIFFNSLWQLLYLRSKITIFTQIKRKKGTGTLLNREIILLLFWRPYFLLKLLKICWYPEPRAGAGAGSRSRSRLDRHHNTVRDQVTMFSRYIWDVFHWGLFKTGLDTVGPQLQLVCRDDGFSPVSYHLFGKGEINLLVVTNVFCHMTAFFSTSNFSFTWKLNCNLFF